MKPAARIVLGVTMSVALAFGFLRLFVPDHPHDFDRLHVFFFNLCSGGTILLFFAGDRQRLSARAAAYFVLSVAYALCAFFEIYAAVLVASVPLFVLVESVRIGRFALLPFDFFRRVDVQDKFLQASLLCLSSGIVIAALVIANDQYLHLVQLPKLTIDVFFLGYSFPLSLLTFSVMFSFVDRSSSPVLSALPHVSFWIITTGVIVFFVFIIFELPVLEVVIANVLLVAVLVTYWHFGRFCRPVQQKWILASGMTFLVFTGLTGVLYLLPAIEPYRPALLVLHGTVSLYGWNLSGLFVIVRWHDFPVFRRVGGIIVLHWLTVFVLSPLGKFEPAFSLLALAAYVALLGIVFFTRPRGRADSSEVTA